MSFKMAPESDEVRRLASAVGAAVLAKDPERERIARQNFAEGKIRLSISKILADAPPLRPEQRDRLAAILNGGE